jgi:hypothetical protein
MYGCCKFGKRVPLLITPLCSFPFSLRGVSVADLQTRGHIHPAVLMASLVARVPPNTTLLQFHDVGGRRLDSPSSSQTPLSLKETSTAEGTSASSPFPALDAFILSVLVRGGVQGRIRKYVHPSSCGMLTRQQMDLL